MDATGLSALEHRLCPIEDKLAMRERIASHSPSVDTDLHIVETMLSDGEALDGVEAWLERQPLEFDLGERGTARSAVMSVESPAGWLLRLVRHARGALVG